ncbi:MAG: hypothetical protein K2K04_00330 [Clostridia bacterium]|nr:hypothetical protein [Clostridia bacterium]
MLNATVELFLSEYFLIKAALGKYSDDSEKLFHSLSKIFLLSEKETEKLYRLTENEITKSITTDKEFMQHQRIQKYSQLIGSAKQPNAEWDEVTSIKGNAILAAQNHNLVPDADASRNVVYTHITTAATGGLVSALRIMGILQCEGIFLSKNAKAGMKNLSKAADWNDCVSTLALLHYRKETRKINMIKLRQEVADTPFEALYEIAAAKYGEADGADIDEVRLLDRAFNSGVLKREVYAPKYARILNSMALYVKDKEKTLFTQSKELVGVIGDLPLKLTHEKTVAVDVSAVKNTSLKREAEAASIVRALNNGDLRELPAYRPLCLCCDSKYILNMYANAISAKSANTHVEIIDVAELSEYDFEPTPNNIFIRSINEDKDNRFLLYFTGDIPEMKIDLMKSILQGSRRAKFHLNNPNVTLNLSAVLPVCLCDKRNAKLLKAYCDVIELSEVKAEEMPLAVRDIIAGKERVYGVKAIRFDGEVSEIFKGYDVDTVEKLIDAAVRAHREKGAVITISREMIQQYSSDGSRPVIGFGGDANGK